MRSLSGQQAQAKRSAAKQATLIVNCCFISRESEWIRRALGEKPAPTPSTQSHIPPGSTPISDLQQSLKSHFPPFYSEIYTSDMKYLWEFV